MKHFKPLFSLIVLVALLAMYSTPAGATGISLTLISRTVANEADGESANPAISADGKYAVFASDAPNLVVNDTNNKADIFVRRLSDGEITRISVSSSGIQGNGFSTTPVLSADGRYVAFESTSTNLVSGDTNSRVDIFVHDRQTGTTTRVSVNSNGVQGFGHSFEPSISADGRYVAFRSDAVNLVGGDTNNLRDLFVHDRQTGQTRRVSVSSSGVQANSLAEDGKISGNGRYVVFTSEATNLVETDANGELDDVFMHDLETSETRLVVFNAQGEQANHESRHPSISSDGRYVAFASFGNNLVENDTNDNYDIFRRDLLTGEVILVSLNHNGEQINHSAFNPVISNDGRFVAFTSQATNLVDTANNGRSQVFFRDIVAQKVVHLSKNTEDAPATESCDLDRIVISGDGSLVLFSSYSDNLVPIDSNNTGDVFLAAPWNSATSQSNKTYDGWIIESNENSGQGGGVNNTGPILNLGDDEGDRQLRAILHFDVRLPINSIITKIQVRIKEQGVTGTNPFLTHGNMLVDMRTGAFGRDSSLQASDFDADASAWSIATIYNEPGKDNWHTIDLPVAAFDLVNRNGANQFRLRFETDDNNNNLIDILRIYSGNASAENQPQMIIQYYIP